MTSPCPEAFAVKTHEPVGQVVVDERVDETTCAGRVIAVHLALHTLDERVEHRQDPTVDLGTFGHGHVGLAIAETVDVGVEAEERVGVVEGAEELAAHLVDTCGVKLEVVPRR